MEINEIIKYVKANGGVVFDNPFYLNLFAMRDETDVNKFNDTLVVYWYDEAKVLHTYSPKQGFTTDPGLTPLTKPVNAKGCAILKEGWYRRLWQKGVYDGKYSALVQVGDCVVYRDNDRDNVLDMSSANLDKGVRGIHMHRALESDVAVTVDGWSIGDQVWASPGEFAYFMGLVSKANASGQVYFSYFLANKKALNVSDTAPKTVSVPQSSPTAGPKFHVDGLTLIKNYEGCRLTAYRCPAGLWTIGYGNTFYEDGTKVKQGDSISQERADKLLNAVVETSFSPQVRRLISKGVNDYQFSALVSFAYNAGIGNLKSSTLLKKVNANPNDATIKDEFLKWVYSGGKVLEGLKRRRTAEAALYFKK